MIVLRSTSNAAFLEFKNEPEQISGKQNPVLLGPINKTNFYHALPSNRYILLAFPPKCQNIRRPNVLHTFSVGEAMGV